MPFPEKRQVIEERLTNWHTDPVSLRTAMAEIAMVLERRNLVARGVLSRRSSGALCIKSFSGARFFTDEGAIDVINLSDLDSWSARASELCERLIALRMGLRDVAP